LNWRDTTWVAWRTAPSTGSPAPFPEDLPYGPARRAIIPGRFRATALPGSAYASPTRSPTASAVLSGMLARGPAGFASRRAISSCDMSGFFLTAYGGGSPCLWPTASSAIASGSCFLVCMVISLTPSGAHSSTYNIARGCEFPASEDDRRVRPPRASEHTIRRGRGPEASRSRPDGVFRVARGCSAARDLLSAHAHRLTGRDGRPRCELRALGPIDSHRSEVAHSALVEFATVRLKRLRGRPGGAFIAARIAA
jgi:hypothetical protein